MQTHWVLDHEAIATAAKYAGLAFTMALGVAGTAADTHEKMAAGVRITRVGWIVIALIVTSSIIGAAGQYYEDQAKQATTTQQLRRLENITKLTEEARERFSGHLKALIEVNIPIDQQILKEPISRYEKRFIGRPKAYNVSMDRTYPRDAGIDAIAVKLRNVAFFVELFNPTEPNKVLLEANGLSASSLDDIDVQSIDRVKRTMTVVFSLHPVNLANISMFSVVDFGDRQLFLRYSPDRDDFFTGARGIRLSPSAVELYDSELNTQLTETYLALQTHGDPNDLVFAGRTKQLFNTIKK